MSRSQWQPSIETIRKYKELGYTDEESYELALCEEIQEKERIADEEDYFDSLEDLLNDD